MIVDNKTLSEFSKVFIYPSSRKFYKDEMPEISDKTEHFLNDFGFNQGGKINRSQSK